MQRATGQAAAKDTEPASGAALETAFTFRRTDWTGIPSGYVQAGDMDSDGDPDLVAIGGENLSVLENLGAARDWRLWGDPGRHGLDSTGRSGMNGAVLYDVDADGFTDVVGAKYRSDMGWWQNPAGPLSERQWEFHRLAGGVEGWYMHDMIRGDMDLDGGADEFVAVLQRGYWDSPVHIYWVRPGPDPYADWERHVIAHNHAGPNNNHSGVDLADIDGDGDIDLAFCNGWFESAGDPAGPWTWHQLTRIYGVSNTLARDMDADGDLDLVMSAGHHGQGVYWFENTGRPTDVATWRLHFISGVVGDIEARHRYAPPEAPTHPDPGHIHHPEGLQVLDLDFDGDPDVIAAELYFGEDPGEPDWDEPLHNVYVYENTGGRPPVWRKHNVAPNGWPCHQLQVFDVNADGRMDVIAEGPEISNVTYLENATPFATRTKLWLPLALVPSRR